MAEKFESDVKLSPQELAAQLRQPTGDVGQKVGEQMNKGNQHICLNSYKVLDPKKEDNILEIGMGNGFFVKDLLQMADELKYTGVDFSGAMVEQATNLNKQFITSRKAEFYEASIEKLPFGDSIFDSITTTNTIYFWPQPEENIKELLRVLKPNGKLLIGYRSKSFMDEIELSKYGFDKYKAQDVENLLLNAGFSNVSTKMLEEPELEFDGKAFKMEGYYTVGFKS